MDIAKATEIIKKDFEIFKKEHEKDKPKGKGATSQVTNHHNHFVKFVQSHGFQNSDPIETFFQKILDPEFVEPANMPSSWKQPRAFELAFRSLNKCLSIPDIQQYLLSVISHDIYQTIIDKCSELAIAYRKKDEEKRDNKSISSKAEVVHIEQEQELDDDEIEIDAEECIKMLQDHIKTIEAKNVIIERQLQLFKGLINDLIAQDASNKPFLQLILNQANLFQELGEKPI
ncbi:MAG: hypothetical protein ACK5XN_18190 [Bacteroidota bacterium]|jgi:hypothetical protein